MRALHPPQPKLQRRPSEHLLISRALPPLQEGPIFLPRRRLVDQTLFGRQHGAGEQFPVLKADQALVNRQRYPLRSCGLRAIFIGMVAPRKTVSFRATSQPERAIPPELAPTPRLFTAPELVGRENDHVVIRHDDDTDASYAARVALVNLILGIPSKS